MFEAAQRHIIIASKLPLIVDVITIIHRNIVDLCRQLFYTAIDDCICDLTSDCDNYKYQCQGSCNEIKYFTSTISNNLSMIHIIDTLILAKYPKYLEYKKSMGSSGHIHSTFIAIMYESRHIYIICR